ncbi:alkaline phosphatase [Virgibacillus sediminis]|uniref:Alkaline phosphatase n=1 Tax=Virgibacillus sediminis TaxID=202260 RepID=A0ABV7A800_9BACI
MIKKLGVAALSTGLLFSAVAGAGAHPGNGNGNGNPPEWAGQPGGPWSVNEDERGNPEQEVENVIYMIPDGFNTDYAANYRMFKGEEAVWDEHLKGMFSTYSASSNITDSAAAGTAMATGVKTNNGTIGLDADGNEVETILETLKQEEDKSAGLVATSAITHATPAAFASHNESRNNETEIASDLLENEVDVLLGGGKNNFLPESEGGNQPEDNLLEQAQDQGYQFVETPEALSEADVDVEEGEKLLGLFADGALSPEVLRDEAEEPSLAEMTETAISTLEQDEDGFFLMVEGSQIDWAGHDNDAGWAMTDVAAFEQAVEEAIEFAEEDGETLVVVAGDHETGGMTVGANGSATANPEVLRDITATGDYMASELNEDRSNVADVLNTYTGFDLTDEEIQFIQEADDAATAINQVVSDRANIGWTSTNHTGVDIQVYAYGPGADEFSGYHDNTDLPKIIADVLDVEFGE